MGQLRKVTINKGQGGVGGNVAGKDHICGFVFDSTTYPTALAGYTSLSAGNPIAKLTSLQDAINLGMNDSHGDETKATGGQFLITTAGAAGEVWYLYVTPAFGVKTLLGSYTVVTGDTVALVAAGLVASVNLRKNIHGYAATISTATVVLAAPAKLGVSINGGTVLSSEVYTSTGGTGTGASTKTQFTGGVGSIFAILYYHLKMAFDSNPRVVIYLGIYNLTTFSGTGVEALQQYANGDIRNMFVWTDTASSSLASMVGILQTSGETMNSNGRPCSIVLESNSKATTASALTDLSSLISASKEAFVSVSIANSASGEGWRLLGVCGVSIGATGAIIGALSRAKVNQNIGEVLSFDLTSGTEFVAENGRDGAALGTGEEVRTLSDNLVTQLDNYRYIFTCRYDDIAGVYLNDSWTCTSITNDFNAIERVRTIDKAGRNVKAALTPLINSNLDVDPTTGKLADSTIALFTSEALAALNLMAIDGEIATLADGSLPSGTVTIDATQDVISTSEIVITIKIVPKGIARAITVNLTFTKSV